MTGIFLITHNNIGQEYINTIKEIFAIKTIPPMSNLAIKKNSSPDQLIALGIKQFQHITKQGNGLILSDLIGSTPANIAKQIAHQCSAAHISGFNLPLLMRAINYHHLPLKQLINKIMTNDNFGICLEYQKAKKELADD